MTLTINRTTSISTSSICQCNERSNKQTDACLWCGKFDPSSRHELYWYRSLKPTRQVRYIGLDRQPTKQRRGVNRIMKSRNIDAHVAFLHTFNCYWIQQARCNCNALSVLDNLFWCPDRVRSFWEGRLTLTVCVASGLEETLLPASLTSWGSSNELNC